MVSICNVRVETESGPIEKHFPSRERADLFACFCTSRGLENVVSEHGTEQEVDERD